MIINNGFDVNLPFFLKVTYSQLLYYLAHFIDIAITNSMIVLLIEDRLIQEVRIKYYNANLS